MTANLKFYVDSHANILTIPMEAVTTLEGGRKTVLVPGPNDTVQRREVKLGINDGKRIEVISGLAESDVVLTLEIKHRKHEKQASSPFGGGGGAGSAE